MLATAIKLMLVTAGLALIATSADAQQIHPRCTKSSDKVKCTCWMENGAVMTPSLRGKGVQIQLQSEHDMDRIIACMRRNGRPNG